MPPNRTPGPTGTRGHEQIDSGTLALAAAAPPAIATSPGDGKEGVSSSVAIKRKYAYIDTADLVLAQIYFATDDDRVDSDDVSAMSKLLESIPKLLKDGFKLTLLCTGSADYRASDAYNIDLGLRRAQSVKSAIDSRISDADLSVEVTSIGESKALQPQGGRRPSLVQIMDDRKVAVTIEEFTPPVILSVTGNWILNSTIEVTEINNGGRVVAPASSQALRKVREYEGLEHDPILPLILIRTSYSIQRTGNTEEALVRCRVVHQVTNKVLFTASAQTDARNTRKTRLHYDPKNPRVKRALAPGEAVPDGHVVEEKVVTGVNDRALSLSEPIYAQLKGTYSNITRRVEAVLAQQ